MTTSSAVHYRICAHDVHAHLWHITLTIPRPAKNQTVSLPVWIPGSYMVREFSKNLQNLCAHQGTRAVATQQLDKCTWRLANSAAKPLVLQYKVYAFDSSVRASWLTAQRAFFNPTSLCLRVHGLEHKAHTLTLDATHLVANYEISTWTSPQKSLKNASGKHLHDYLFADYDELADTPFEIGQFWRGSFQVRGVEHEFVVSGAPASFDGKRLLADTQKIVEAELQFWHGSHGKPSFKRYVFMLNTVDEGYGGLEHRNSTALICSRRDLPRLSFGMGAGSAKPKESTVRQPEGYTTLLGLISHEYFHTWNVKRLKPQEFVHYDYSRENYTQMLWFFEGLTSYYDDLLLRRAGLIDNAQYLRLLAKTINQVQQTPGRKVQSVAQASQDAWVKYYRQDENTPNATVSYYTKGSLVGLCLDLTLRKEGSGSLDEVMCWLYKAAKADRKDQGGITEADVAQALQAIGGRSYAQELAAWVHGTEDLPVVQLLQAHGVSITAEPATALPIAQRLGLRVSESSGSLMIKTVLRGGLAESAGFAAGDEWLAVGDWRVHKLEDLAVLAGPAKKITATVSRDKRILRLKLAMPLPSQAPSSFMLRSSKDEPLTQWLLG